MGKDFRPFAVSCIVPIDGKILFVRHTYGIAKGRILIPGGYLKENELPSQAAVRELMEETGVNAKPVSICSARCKAGQWIFVFNMEYISGTPRSDGYENSEVLLLTPQEAVQRDDITNMSRSIIKAYIANPERVIPLNDDVPPTYNKNKYEFFGI